MDLEREDHFAEGRVAEKCLIEKEKVKYHWNPHHKRMVIAWKVLPLP